MDRLTAASAAAPAPGALASQLTLQLRAAITRRDSLRPGTSRHWNAACEVRTLQAELVRALRLDPPEAGG